MRAAAGALPVLALLVMAAAPKNSFVMATPMPNFGTQAQPATPSTNLQQGYSAAPTPDQDASAPRQRASDATTVGPGLFNRRDQYRGEGLSPSSSAQIEQERHVKPGAGIKFSVPLQ